MQRSKTRKARRMKNAVQGIDVSDPEFLTQPIPATSPFSGVWSGRIGRLRWYSGQVLHVFLVPGTTADWIGTTTDPTMMKALFLARDNGRWVDGYTGNNVLSFIDY